MKRVVVAVEQEDARINHGLPYFAELDAHNWPPPPREQARRDGYATQVKGKFPPIGR
jgi:hypothetical protein